MTIIPPGLLTLQDMAAGADAQRLLLRALPTLIGAAALIVLARVRANASFRSWSFRIVAALAVSLLVSNAARPESELIPLRGRMLGPTLVYLLAPNTMARQAGTAVGLSIGLIALRAVRVVPFEGWPFFNDVLFAAILNAAGILLIHSRLQFERSLDDAWANEHSARLAAEQAQAEVRTLEGIIPICSFCRRLRSEAGDWQRLEHYVRDRTGVRFSHGACPDCIQTHYPQFADEASR